MNIPLHPKLLLSVTLSTEGHPIPSTSPQAIPAAAHFQPRHHTGLALLSMLPIAANGSPAQAPASRCL